MKRCLFIFFFALSLSAAYSQSPDRELVQRVKEATLFLEVVHEHPIQDGDLESSGTGFFIDQHGRIATNAHVISPWLSAMGLPFPAPLKRLRAYIHSGSDSVKKVPLRVLLRDQERDLAILAPEEEVKVPASMELSNNEGLYETMPVWAFGYPYGKKHSVLHTGPDVTVTKGSISALRRGDRDTLRTIQMDASVAPGNSGGPLISAGGDVLGIVAQRGDNEMNQAVPAHFLGRMLDQLPDERLKQELSLSVKGDGANTCLFVDGEAKGKLPWSSDSLSPGLHRVELYADGHRAELRSFSLIRDSSIRCSLDTVRPTLLEKVPKEARRSSKNFEMSLGDRLFQEGFDNPDRFRQWKQNTGGRSKRTWYLEDGELHQYQRDGMLHAITLGKKIGDMPYRMSAKLRLPGKEGEGDDRAGLIFGDDGDGFYLFRIYRNSNKAELAYHSRSPFGWTIIRSVSLKRDLSPEEWYELSVSVIGDRVLCELDGEQVLQQDISSLRKGDLGFYSVQSKASFDSLRVDRLKVKAPLDDAEGDPGAESFWFTDRFDRNSGWWWPIKRSSGELVPPFVSTVGSILRTEAEEWHDIRFQRYQLADMRLRAIISCSKGEEKAAFECGLFENEDRKLAIRIKTDSSVQALLQKGNEETLLASDTLSNRFFGGPTLFDLSVHDGELLLENRMQEVLRADLPASMEGASGNLSFSVRNADAVFHRITVRSIESQKGEKD